MTTRAVLEEPRHRPDEDRYGARHAAALAVAEQVGPRLGGLTKPVGEHHQFLASVRADAG